jgi:Tol biopolymer transport system component/DNA-binding winged helix-turn-helix (wHTH) protein
MKIEQTYQLGSCLVYPHEFAIQFENGEKQSLQPRWIEVLNYLVEHHPRIIPREELIDKIWLGNSYVGEKSLTNVIWNLRNSFKKEGEEQLIIETIRKAGYRLLVEPITTEPESTVIVTATTSDLPKTNHSSVVGFLTKFSSLLVLMVMFYWLYLEDKAEVKQTIIETVTSDPGEEMYVSISPNGRFIVYRMRNQEDPVNLYLKDLQQPDVQPRQLTFDDSLKRHSVWSHDGNYLFFARENTKKRFCDYIQLDITSLFEKKVASCPLRSKHNYLDISPDGKILAFLNNDIDSEESGIYFLDLMTQNAKPVRFSCAVDCKHKDRDMAFSPDGKRLAITRRFNLYNEDIFIVDIATGNTQRITEGVEDVRGLSWHADNLHLVYGERKSGIHTGYWLNTKTKKQKSLSVDAFSFPVFNKVDNSLFYHKRLRKYQIKSLSLNQAIASSPEPILLSNFSQRQPHYSSISKQIAYLSNETGVYEIWLSNKQGKERKQLTSIGLNISFPRWSHDGKKLVFLAPLENQVGLKIYTIDVATKQLVLLNSPFQDHGRPTWSTNDDAIISAVSIADETDLHLISINTDHVERLTFDGGLFGNMIDKNKLIYSRSKGGLWQKTISGNTLASSVREVISSKRMKEKYFWVTTDDGIYYQENIRDGEQINFYDFASEDTKPLAKFPRDTFSYTSPLVVVQEDNKLIFAVLEYKQSDLQKLQHPFFN